MFRNYLKLIIPLTVVGALAIIPAVGLGLSLPGSTSSTSPQYGSGTGANDVPHTITVMTSGQTSGTQLTTLNIAKDGSATKAGTELVSKFSTHGGYISPDGVVYADGFEGGGVKAYQKINGTWQEQTQWDAPAKRALVMCSMDLRDGKQDPNKGLLEIGDIATGFNYFYDMSKHDYSLHDIQGNEAGYFGATGTVCDMSFSENSGPNLAWTSGHTNNIYTWDTTVDVALPTGDHEYALKNVRPLATKLGHQSRTITAPNGTEYEFIADGSNNRFIVLDSATDGQKFFGYITIGLGVESHSMGFMTDGPRTDKSISSYAVSANFATGDLLVDRVFKSDGSPNVDGPTQEKPVVTADFPGIGTLSDICGVDVVNVDGGWDRN